jgi:hypothetical protein
MVFEQADRQSVIERLRPVEKQFDDILELIGDSRVLRGDAKFSAQTKLRELKENLQVECKRMNTLRGQESLTPCEMAFYEPAMRKASAEISVRWNSLPGRQWHTNLYGARINISHALFELEHPRKAD